VHALKLYDYPPAPNPRRVRVYLAEKGIEVPRETVDLTKRANRTPAFLEKNPRGGIPVLELDDGTCIAESIAICRYFEALHPEPPLFGATPREVAEIEMWQRRIELGLLVPVGMVWVHGSPITARLLRQIPEAAAQNRVVVARFLAWLDGELGGRPFVAGDRFTVPDITLLCTLDFATGLVGIELDPSLQGIARWHREVSARPSASA
jgi:glutathione S-transferase